MNKWKTLLAALDQVYGFDDQAKSSMKKIKQGFDEKANEHVIVIEYRVMRGDNMKLTKKRQKERRESQRAKKIKVGELLRDINTRVMTGDEIPQVDNFDADSPNPDYPL